MNADILWLVLIVLLFAFWAHTARRLAQIIRLVQSGLTPEELAILRHRFSAERDRLHNLGVVDTHDKPVTKP